MAHSCIHCQKYILVQPRLNENILWEDVLEVDLRSVIVAASDGCAFFNWSLSRHSEASNPARLDELGDKVLLRLSMWAGVRDYSASGQYVSLRWVTEPPVAEGDSESSPMYLYTMAENGKYRHFRRFCMELTQIEGEPAASYNLARPFRKSVGSAASFEQARTWLDECNKTHPFCQVPSQDALPLRVVEIYWEESENEPIARLTKTTDKSPYAALTYCWGNSSSLKEIQLTNQTYQDWFEDIPFSRLPKTLQDSIITTWKLGLQFIWIDCLCIAQDDDQEKATEIAKMPQIYRGAYITISAARSQSSDEGFLHDVQVPSTNASIFKMAYACPKGRLGTILLFHDSVSQLEEPINTRGWTLQEYLLSQRLLIYGVHGLRFGCQEGERYDDEKAAEQALSTGNNRELALLRGLPENLEIARERWLQILFEYSMRTLSYPEDRLLAISGIANYYSTVLKDEYLAGIWRHDLPAGLMWGNIGRNFPRPLQSRAPSWSWAAVDGSVRTLKTSSLVDPQLTVVSHSIQLVELTAPFGAVLSGHLTLKGLFRKVLWDGISLFSTSSPDKKYLASTIADAVFESEFSDYKTGFMDVWCLQIYPFDEATHGGPSGLILTREHSQSFKRLGTFDFADYLIGLKKKDATFYSQLDLEQREWSRLSEMGEVVIV